MSQAEFNQWIDFYRSWPFDDFHRFHRPAALIASSLGGGDIVQRLEWLQPPTDHDENGHTSADRDLYEAAGIKPKRKTA